MMKTIKLVLLLLVGCSVAFAQVPDVRLVSPISGFPGEVVGIAGNNFQAGSRVFFGAVEGAVISVSDQLIEAEVPVGATFKEIRVINGGSNAVGYTDNKFLMAYGGNQSFASTVSGVQQDFPAQSGLFDVCLCDLDGDGLSEMIGANTNSNQFTYYLNTSSAATLSFGPQQNETLPAGTSALNVTCGELNNDGRPDLIFSEANNGTDIFIYLNTSTTGSVSFQPVRRITATGYSTKRIAIQDIDRDGRSDVVVTDQSSNRIGIFRNTSSGSFSLAPIISVPVNNASSTAALEVADFNNDGRPDIATSQFLTNDGGFYLLINNSTPGSIQFRPSVQFNVPGTLVNLKSLDVNKDGRQDLIATRFLSNTIGVYLNQTTGSTGAVSFSSGTSFTGSRRPWGLDIADFDGDGDGDILVGNVGDDLALSVFENRSTTTSVIFQSLAVPVTFINRNVAAGDLDNDGKPELVFASVDDTNNSIPASQISVIRCQGCIVPEIEPQGPLTVCDGNQPRLTTVRIPDATYEWYVDGNLEKSGNDHFIDPVLSGNYTVTLISGTCSETSVPVQINIQGASSLAPAAINPVSSVCQGGTLTLTVVSDVGASSYEWSGPDGFSATGISVEVNDFRAVNAGKYILDVFDGSCLAQTEEIVVEIVAVPDFFVTESGSGSYCQGDPVTLSVTNNAGFDYQWFDQNGSIPGETGTTFQPTVTGSYFVEATDVINSGCQPVQTNPVAINFFTQPTASFTGPASICANSTIQFNNTSVTDPSATATYLWDFGDGNTSTAENPTNLFTTAGSYNIQLSVNYQNVGGCMDTFTETVVVSGALDVQIVADKTVICQGESLTLSTSSTFDSYNWSTGEDTPEITIDEGGTFNVTISDATGCTGNASIVIDELPAPIVEITSNKNNIAPGEVVTLSATGLTTYSWEPAALVGDPSAATVTAEVSETTTFSVTGLNDEGCQGQAELQIRVELDAIGGLINPKKFFTPGGDDMINEFWVVENIDQFPQCGVKIYDQTGNLLYESLPYLNDWDGTNGSTDLPEGVYYFTIQCGDGGIVKSGSITLFRK